MSKWQRMTPEQRRAARRKSARAKFGWEVGRIEIREVPSADQRLLVYLWWAGLAGMCFVLVILAILELP
jgi:hypothetical protein